MPLVAPTVCWFALVSFPELGDEHVPGPSCHGGYAVVLVAQEEEQIALFERV